LRPTYAAAPTASLRRRHNTKNDRVDKGATVPLISSEFEEAIKMSDRISGHAVGHGPPEMERSVATKGKVLVRYETRAIEYAHRAGRLPARGAKEAAEAASSYCVGD
jgi:hypothetical protein